MTSRISSVATRLRVLSRAPDGFTLVEMLVVLSIITILLGVSVGTLQRNVPRRDLARNELMDKLRRARLFAVAEQAPAWVRLTRGTEEEWPVVTALGRKVVGTWHLEGLDAEGFPRPGTAYGAEEDPRGVIGKALWLSGAEPSYLDLGTAGSYESEAGLACELFVKLRGSRQRVLFSKGEVFRVLVENDGSLSATVRLRGPEEDGKAQPVFETVSTEAGAVEPERWEKVAASFDGLVLRLAVNDIVAAEHRLECWSKVLVDPRAPLWVGSAQEPFQGSLDEVKFANYSAETSEPLVDMSVLGNVDQVRFAPGGELDPSFHSGAAEVGLVALGGAEVWVRVGLLGDVN